MWKWWSKLDTVVKIALCVFVGSFGLIWGGMYLTRPDRSIPPYSIGSQEQTAVAVHVPPWTSDGEIETLIDRFRKVSREDRNFGRMKIQPTTEGDPDGRYRRVTIYIFSSDVWAEPEILHKYLATVTGRADEQAVKEGFEKAVRGLYRLEEDEEEGRIGPLLPAGGTAGTAAYARELFKSRVPTVSGPGGAEKEAQDAGTMRGISGPQGGDARRDS